MNAAPNRSESTPTQRQHRYDSQPTPQVRKNAAGKKGARSGGIARGSSHPKRRKPKASTRKPPRPAGIDAVKRQAMIAEAAYYRAERRGFVGGDPAADWAAAEAEIDLQLAGSRASGHWSEKVQRMLREWLETHQSRWSEWPEKLVHLPDSPTPELWSETVNSWQQAVENTLQAQSEWVQMWAEALQSVEGAPSAAKELAIQSKVGIQRWTESQREHWQTCFRILRTSSSHPTPHIRDEAETVLRAWQESAREAMEAYMEKVFGWLR